ncbi:hypothetical protein [Rhizomonospora bruguierae]|uniref:hypothetical protein n=1 Tax=Rhizomonospora bruguierae TaxID=1581705 RepID=UPI001BCC00F5|nr:hypothetical protein [Micromonospora sp. NBRC 107566]
MEWDPLTARNMIMVRGATLTDVPILNTNEAVSLTPGAVVGLLASGRNWFILGRVTVPGTPAAASALALGRTEGRVVHNSESTNSTAYADLATVGPTMTVQIGPSGRALVMIGAMVMWGDGGGFTELEAYVSYAYSGASARGAGDGASFSPTVSASINVQQGSFVDFIGGLPAGDYTFTAKYRVSNGSAFFNHRVLVVLPF